jgi:hypothetical protein
VLIWLLWSSFLPGIHVEVGQMKRQYSLEEEDTKFVLCDICDGDILIDSYSDIGDTVCCDDCGTYFMLRSLSPVQISLIEDDEEEDSYKDLNFDD